MLDHAGSKINLIGVLCGINHLNRENPTEFQAEVVAR